MDAASRVATGVAGIAAVVLLFAGQLVGAIGSRTEPAFDSSTRDIVAFLGSLRSGPQTAGSVIVLVGVVAFLTFAAGLPPPAEHTTNPRAAIGGLRNVSTQATNSSSVLAVGLPLHRPSL